MRAEREENRRRFWQAVDSQSTYYYGDRSVGWSKERAGQCISLRSDGDRCGNTVPDGAGFCDMHYAKFLDWACEHLAEEATRQARSDDPDAFRFVIDNARLFDAISTLEAANVRVYFIACGDAVKIGYSKNPSARLTGLKHQRNAKTGRTLTPEHLDLSEAVIVGEILGGQKVEQRIHSLLATYRLVGEWFRATPTVIAAIDCLVFGHEPPRSIEAGLRDMCSSMPGAGRRRNQVSAA